jgi:hypothetical protein
MLIRARQCHKEPDNRAQPLCLERSVQHAFPVTAGRGGILVCRGSGRSRQQHDGPSHQLDESRWSLVSSMHFHEHWGVRLTRICSSVIDPYKVDTTALAAVGTWHILQGFIENLPTLDATVKSRTFNLWTESYGGHYGPAFFSYFYDQNQAIQNGTAQGCELNMHALGIINGIISERIQAPYYPEMAYNNPYGIKAVNESIYNYMKMNYYFPEGCKDYLDNCDQQDLSTPDGNAVCSQATAICRSLVESPYYCKPLPWSSTLGRP